MIYGEKSKKEEEGEGEKTRRKSCFVGTEKKTPYLAGSFLYGVLRC